MATKTLPIKVKPKSNWLPKWVITSPSGSEIGVTIDDHCVVTLTKISPQVWHPTTHVPHCVTEFVKQLSESEFNSYP